MTTASKLNYDPNAQYDFTAVDVEYLRLPDMRLMARIYRPEGPGPWPTIVDVHGGAWTTGDRFQNTLLDESLCETGLLIIALDHRLSPKYPYPAQVQDVNYGLRWAKAHAAEYGGLPAPLGGLGTSSGGHTLLLNAMKPHHPEFMAHPMPDHPELDAGIAYYMGLWSVLDPHARYVYQRDEGHVMHLVRNSEAYFGTEERMKEASPQRMLDENDFEFLPPAMIVEPFPDEFIPSYVPQRFVESYRARGGHVETDRYSGPHGFARIDSPETQRAIDNMKDFIARNLKELAG